ncbi:MAG: sigma-70 family RNA polymerase sigma factor [Candidatus Kapabacteria bacterium]|jgi:RNA polymerase sigma factor (sigma-70 family)|nr:sigma-70 family RNA polymerase sigma factor [Candidatus Kapabacteria bacterium]
MQTKDAQELYKCLSRQFPRARAEEVYDAIYDAYECVLMAHERDEDLIRNVQAFATVVARRILTKDYYRQRRIANETDLGSATMVVMESQEAALAYQQTERAEEARLDTERIMSELPDHYAELLRRHYLDGCTFEQLAKEYGCSPESLRKRHERALKWARKRFMAPSH